MPPAVLRMLAVLVASTSAVACGGSGEADDGLTVFAASSLTEVTDALAAAFVGSSSEIDRVEVDTGGSDALARLITDGVPADVLLTADRSTMDLLVDRPVDPVVVAHNRAAVVVPVDNPARIESLTELEGSDITLAVCEPVVPCGDAARELFERAGIDPDPATLEPNVRSVLTKVELGEVDAGVVYRTDAEGSSAVRSIPVDDAPRRPVAAAAVSERDAADAFVDFLRSDGAEAIFSQHGFEGP